MSPFKLTPILRVFLIGAVLVFAGAVCLSAFGAREDPIDQARELIDESRYNDAIVLLRDVIRTQPERFDEAESLLREIRQTRERYNDLWQELIFVLENEPDNIDRAYRVIEQMESVDEAPSPEAVREFQQWRNIVVLRFNLDQFEQITAEAIAAVSEGRFVDALRVYSDGLGLFREEFESLDYAEQIGAEAFAIEARLDVLAQSLASRSLELEARVDEYLVLLEQDDLDAELLESATADLRDAFVSFVVEELEIAELGSRLRELNQVAQESREMGNPDPYLTFTTWFTFGRTSADGTEGLFGAARAIAERELERFRSGAVADADARIGEAIALGRDSAYDRADRRWRQVSLRFVGLRDVLSILDVWNERRQERIPGLARAEVNVRETERLRYDFGARAASAPARVAAVRSDVEAQFSGTESDADSWLSLSEMWREAREPVERLATDLRELPPGAEMAVQDGESMLSAADELLLEISAAEQSVARNLLEDRRENAEPRYEALVRRQQSAEAIAFVGVEVPDPGELPGLVEVRDPDAGDFDDDLVYRYPDIGAQRMVSIDEAAGELVSELEDTLLSFENANAPVVSNDKISETLLELRRLVEQTNDLRQRIARERESAEDLFAEALQLQEFVVDTLDEAQNAVAEDPDFAQQLFDEATDALVESLDIRQDREFRDAMDTRLAALGADIQEARYQRIVVEVRDAIEEGRRLYRQDAFGEAENVLIQARERWNSVNDESNSEVQFWLRLTQAALNLQADRDLAETDPLFRPLGNYLSLAYDAFERAQEARQAGNEVQSNLLLSRAEDNIQSVVSARPFNQEARVLGLRITELTNPDEFPEIFEQRFEQALAEAEEDPLAALNDLYDLQAIDPDYPELENRIEELEIEVGIRERPVDQQALNRSSQLLARARNAYQPGNRDTAERAQGLLEEAIELNPDNIDAVRLFDQVRLDLGSSAAPTLSTSELQQFRQAENLFIDGSIGRAIVIVERLWQDEENRRYPPLAELRNRLVGQ